MAYKIVWSDRGLSHLREVLQFIAEENPLAADKVGHGLLRKISFLSEFPQL